MVYYDLRLEVTRDIALGAWDQPGAAALVTLLGAGPRSISGVKSSGNQAGDRIEPTTDLMNAPLRAFLTHPDEAVLEQDYREAKRLAEILYQVDDAGDADLLAGDFAAEKEFDHA